jgi:hypothetical protein
VEVQELLSLNKTKKVLRDWNEKIF